MSRQFPEVNKIRARIQSRIGQAKAKIQGKMGGMRGSKAGGILGQGKVLQGQMGGGQFLKKIRGRADSAMQKVKERKPNLIPKVKEFRPGSRIRQILPKSGIRGDLTDLPSRLARSGKASSIADEPAYPFNGREIVIEL